MDEDGSFMDFPAEFSCLGKVSQIEPSFYDLIEQKTAPVSSLRNSGTSWGVRPLTILPAGDITECCVAPGKPGKGG
jgi:hypothetical protein